jgi:hypothetical protein
VFAQGGEHDVFFQKRSGRYLKATRQDRHKGYGIALGSHIHGATPSEYLDRLFLQNCIFDDDIRLERVVQNIVLPENWTGGLDGESEGTIIPSREIYETTT